MHYHLDTAIELIQSPYRQHSLYTNITHIAITIAQQTDMLLSTSAELMIEKELLEVPFDTLCSLIQSATQSPDIYHGSLEQFKQHPHIKKYEQWSKLQLFFYHLEVFQKLSNSSWGNITPILSTQIEYILSTTAIDNPYPLLNTNDADTLASLCHAVTREHIQATLNNISELNSFRSFAQYKIHQNPPTVETQAALKDESVTDIENSFSQAMNIVSLIQAVFNNTENIDFYTCCIRIFDSILTTPSKGALEQQLIKHYQHYNIPNNDNLLKLHQMIHSFKKYVHTHTSTAPNVIQNIIQLLLNDRASLVYTRHNNHASMNKYTPGYYAPTPSELTKNVTNNLKKPDFAQKAAYLCESSQEKVKKTQSCPSATSLFHKITNNAWSAATTTTSEPVKSHKNQ